MRTLLMSLLLLIASPALAATRVVATVPDLGAIAIAVGGDHVQVTTLAHATQDPHFVDARPNLALALAKADLLVLNGLDLEVGWLPTLLTGARNGKIQPGAPGYLDASMVVTVLERPTAPIDRSMGDVHPGGNPHYTLDPRNARPIAHAIADRLARIDPANAAAYAANADRFVAELDAARVRWEAKASALRGAPVIELHRSFVYLASWLGMRIVADIEPKPGIPPTPKQVLTVVATAKAEGVERVLVEEWYPSTTAATIADNAGARLIVLPGQTHVQEGQTYLAHIEAVVDALVGVKP